MRDRLAASVGRATADDPRSGRGEAATTDDRAVARRRASADDRAAAAPPRRWTTARPQRRRDHGRPRSCRDRGRPRGRGVAATADDPKAAAAPPRPVSGVERDVPAPVETSAAKVSAMLAFALIATILTSVNRTCDAREREAELSVGCVLQLAIRRRVLGQQIGTVPACCAAELRHTSADPWSCAVLVAHRAAFGERTNRALAHRAAFGELRARRAPRRSARRALRSSRPTERRAASGQASRDGAAISSLRPPARPRRPRRGATTQLLRPGNT